MYIMLKLFMIFLDYSEIMNSEFLNTLKDLRFFVPLKNDPVTMQTSVFKYKPPFTLLIIQQIYYLRTLV